MILGVQINSDYTRSAQVGRKLSHEQNRLMRTKVRPAPGKTALLNEWLAMVFVSDD